MVTSFHPSRRQVIVGVGVSALALAGCADGEDTGAAPNSDESAGSPEAPAEGTTLTALDDVTVGESVLVKSDGAEFLVCRPSADEAVAFSAICTHKGCTVEPSGQELKCPCHSSIFSTTDGSVLGGPAEEPLAKIDVHVKSGEVIAGTES